MVDPDAVSTASELMPARRQRGGHIVLRRPGNDPFRQRCDAVHSRPPVPIVFTSRNEPLSFAAPAPEGEGFTYPGKHLWAAREGQPLTDYDEAPVAQHLKGPEVTIEVDIGLGEGRATVWTCDLTHGYIAINADYRS